MKKNKSKIISTIIVSTGVLALGAGAYYYFGPKSKKHIRDAKVWIVGMKTEIEEKIKKIDNLTRSVYQKTIDVIAGAYSKKYKEHTAEINVFAKKLKSEWKNVQQPTKSIVKKNPIKK